jgi:hypothetical protein
MSSEPVSKTFAAKAAGSVANPALPDSPALDDKEAEAELRRGYGIVDMRFNGCVKRENDRALLGNDCPAGFFIYGPYVPVPADSEIDISFEIKPSKDITVYADIVSQMGSQTLAGLNRQRVAGGQPLKLGYRVHVFNADVNVESRIGMDAEPGTHFEITNLTMTVR